MTTFLTLRALPPQDFLDGSQPCREVDPDVFFPDERGRGASRAAERVCAGCEVRVECRDWALGAEIEYGIWGGVAMETEGRGAHAIVVRRRREERREQRKVAAA